jgi:WD40 repeat protein
MKYHSPHETVDIRANSEVPVVPYTSTDMFSMLKNKTSGRQRTLIACCASDSVHIYDLSNMSRCSITITAICAMVFLSEHELVFAVIEDAHTELKVYNISYRKFTKTKDIGKTHVRGLEARRNSVLLYSLTSIGKWDTLTDEYISVPQEYAVEMCFMHDNQFILCAYENALSLWSISPFECLKTLTAKPISVNYSIGGIYFVEDGNLVVLDPRTETTTKLMPITDGDAYSTKIIDHKIALVFEDPDKNENFYCSIYNMETKKLEEKAAFCPASTTYKPFVSKGSLVVYYEDENVRVYDVASMRQVYNIEGPFGQHRADIAIW